MTRLWPIHAPPPEYRKASEAFITVNDLVTWSERLHSGRVRIGIVIDARWIMPMWFDVPNKSSICVYPEAVVLWPEGTVTNTVMSLLRKVE